MVKSFIRVFDCISESSHDPPYYVDLCPWMACYQVPHIWLVAVLSVVVPTYLFLSLPFGVVGGDASVVAWDDLFNLQQWRYNAVQQAEILDVGPMNTVGRYSFWHKLVEGFAIVSVPCLSIMLTS